MVTSIIRVRKEFEHKKCSETFCFFGFYAGYLGVTRKEKEAQDFHCFCLSDGLGNGKVYEVWCEVFGR